MAAKNVEQEIRRLAQGFSTEVLPREATPDTVSSRAVLAPGTYVYITFLPSTSFAEVVSASAQLRREGFNPVPHIAARSLRSARELDDYLARLCGEASVDQALVIAGDLDTPRGDFHCALQLLETGLFAKHGIRRIGIAGHPEGHPVVSAKALDEALLAKAAFARRSGAEMYLVTQFCFEPGPLIEFDKALQRAGIALPVHAGLPGVTTVRSLLAYARSCGIGPSVRTLTRRGGSLARLTAVRAPDGLLAALARHRMNHPASAIKRVHVFPLGAFERTARWMAAVRDGRIAMEPGSTGFKIVERNAVEAESRAQ